MSQRSASSGFSLIELMIVVSIIAIIASIAVPSYQTHVENTRRTTAQGDLLELAQWLERQYSGNFSFQDDDGDDLTLPFDHSPKGNSEDDAFYSIELDVEDDGASFVLTASPKGVQTSDDCGDLTLDDSGNRDASEGDADNCW